MATNTNSTNTNAKPKTTKTSTSSTAAKKDEQIAALEAQIAALKEMIQNMATAAPATTTVAAQPTSVNIVTPNTDVVLVYCSDSMGHLNTAHVDLTFNCWGEQFTVSRSQFDEIVGKYRHWFDQGILAVCGDTEEGIRIAAAKGIKTHTEFYLDAKKLESIGKMSVAQIEDLWNKTTPLSHKQSIVTFVKRKFIEKDPGYYNREKIDLFNRLTDGAFTREQDELSGRIKIEPTNMMKA